MGANYFQNMLRVCKSVYNTKAIERTSQHDRTTSQTDSVAAESEKYENFQNGTHGGYYFHFLGLEDSKNCVF